jgi:septum site-determining protein MinC
MAPNDKAPAARAFDLENTFELKQQSCRLLTLRLLSKDANKVVEQLKRRSTADFFAGEMLLVDGQILDTSPFDFALLASCLRELGALALAVAAINTTQKTAAVAAGLAVLAERSLERPEPATAETTVATATPQPQQTELPLLAQQPNVRRSALVIDRPVRSGQQIYAKDADLVLLDGVAVGAEVMADGCVHVYGPLRGRVHAGVSGDENARIFARNMNPQLVSIAGIYRTLEDELPANIHNRAAQVLLDGNRIVFMPLGTL